MSSDVTHMDNLSSSPNDNLYSNLETNSFSRSSSIDSSGSSNKNHIEAQTSTNAKDSSVKVPYPVLSDHRDPSSVLILLQKETQSTSKRVLDVLKQIEDCEKRLNSHSLPEKHRTGLKCQRMQRKQQLDALKKHERRVNLQIDYITTRTEIKGLEDEQQQTSNEKDSDEYKQIDILAKKLKQKLEQMKIYMRTRNEQMKKATSKSSSSQIPSDSNRKRPSSSTNASTSHSNKHFKGAPHNKPPVVRLSSRLASHPSKSQPIQTPTVRFLNKTTDSTVNSSSPTTPASSSSTLSPPLIATTSTEEINQISHSTPLNPNLPILEDGEIDVEFDIDELFNEDSLTETQRRKAN